MWLTCLYPRRSSTGSRAGATEEEAGAIAGLRVRATPASNNPSSPTTPPAMAPTDVEDPAEFVLGGDALAEVDVDALDTDALDAIEDDVVDAIYRD